MRCYLCERVVLLFVVFVGLAADRTHATGLPSEARDAGVRLVGRFDRGGHRDILGVVVARGFVVIEDSTEEGPPDERETEPLLGAVYVMGRGPAVTEENAQKLLAPDGTVMRYFGGSMATNGHHIAVTAVGREGPYSSTVGYTKDAPNRVYVFAVGSTGQWELESRLVPIAAAGALDDVGGNRLRDRNEELLRLGFEPQRPSPEGVDNNAGDGLAFLGDTLFVGSSSPGGNIFPNGNRFAEEVVYVFKWEQDSTWRQVWTIKSPEPNSVRGNDGMFGRALAAKNDLLLVGEPEYGKSGAVFLFERGEGEAWRLREKVVAPTKQLRCGFGRSVAFDGRSAVVGSEDGDCPTFIYDLLGRKMKLASVVAPSPPSRRSLGRSVALDDGCAAISVSEGVLLYCRLAKGWKDVAVVSLPDDVYSSPYSLALHGTTLAVVGTSKDEDLKRKKRSVFFYALPPGLKGKQ